MKNPDNVPSGRILNTNNRDINPTGEFVLYWMIAFRRTHWNYGLQRSVYWANELGKPLVVLEALRCGYGWASDRIHRFIIEGMHDNQARFEKQGVLYYPYLESEHDDGKGLLRELSKQACVVITDDFPAFFIPRMINSASLQIDIPLEKVDSNGLLPMNSTDRVFTTAYSFRRFLQKEIPKHLFEAPESDPLRGKRLKKLKRVPIAIESRWPRASLKMLNSDDLLRNLPIDHKVKVVGQKGGESKAQKMLRDFLSEDLDYYNESRNRPEEDGTSGFSPYLHFGHISVHQIFHDLMKKEDWFFDRLAERATGSKSGWWGMSENAEAFIDQLVTWRELGFNMCRFQKTYAEYESLPEWALTTLSIHGQDKREFIYSLENFKKGLTHDPLWNAAQMQLVKEGRLHNYLRMLWGKKILEWSETPRKALKTMIELNNKYALDGRGPNSYSGIFWVLGRYDRAWGPEREIFGKVRYMSSKNTARKVRVRNYIKKYLDERS